MSQKISGKTTKDTLAEKFEKDGKLLGDASSIITFAAAAASGEPLSMAAGLALIAKTAGSALTAGTNLVRRFSGAGTQDEPTALQSYERFRILFYVTCQKCFIEALNESLGKLQLKEKQRESASDIQAKETKELKDQLNLQIANLYEAEVTYLFCVEPLAGDVPLYDAFQKWVCSTLTFYGLPAHEAHQIATQSNQEARKRFNVFLSGREESAEWMRNYLALTRQQETAARLADVVGDLAAIRDSLADFTDPTVTLKQGQKKAWDDYRQTLAQLPDLKETMFNEQFGVRKVFVQPSAVYHVRGAEGDAGKPQQVPDLGRVLGALVSSRVSGEDLTILCGGPGSGKSTLCRIMASELAKDPAIYPVFLRLRRVKEGAEIGQFIEESLQKQGLINRIADLREIPNLVLILDGFDELVMASRTRLRHFFAVLRDDLSSGPLRNAKAIISGRDTLFPRGEGLPIGSHVLSLQPFDKAKVAGWGEKWRELHQSGHGNSFHPEGFFDEGKGGRTKPPLHHLVSWPLTLHLVARVHTAGKLQVQAKAAKTIEKAYLYRSILAETSLRQAEQASGQGRLDSKQMRDFLRALAWEMHRRSVDSMDTSEVAVILRGLYPDKKEEDLAELAEVAVVNTPELTKGEETGFEFVHKSFAEYLVGERIAELVEKVAFKAPEFDSEKLTWRMSEQDAARELGPTFGIRLLPEEVQEMFEPMLGCFSPFSKGQQVNEVVAAPARKEGLTRIVERFESMYAEFLRGHSLEIVAKATNVSPRARSPLEAYANYCAGILILGTAASRQLRQFEASEAQAKSFSGEPFKGAFWRCFCVLASGGIILDEILANRLLDGMRVVPSEESSAINDLECPVKLGFLARTQGYEPRIVRHLVNCIRYTNRLEQMLFVMQILIQAAGIARHPSMDRERHLFEMREFRFISPSHDRNPLGEMINDLVENGIVPASTRREAEDYLMRLRKWMERLVYEARERGDVAEVVKRIMYDMAENRGRLSGDDEFDHWMVRFFDMLRHDRDVGRDTGFWGRLFGKR